MGQEKRNYKPVLDYVRKSLKEKKRVTITELTKLFSIPRTTVTYLLERNNLLDKVAGSVEVVSIGEKVEQQDKMSRVKREHKEAVEHIRRLEAELAAVRDISGLSNVVSPRDLVIPKTGHIKEATAFALAGDWHYEEEVKQEAVGGINEFNLGIARRRADLFFERVVRLLNMCRTASDIDTMVVAALGDFITSWIHDDLKGETTPPQALLMVFEQWLSGLTYWLEQTGLKQIIFVGCVGNHGRVTDRVEYKNRAEKNYEWLLYQFLAKWFDGKKHKTDIKFVLPQGYFNWLEVYGKTIRFHHGDGIRYQGGIGGIHIPLKKAIPQWNMARHADLDILGHWHSRKIDQSYVVNGSLIGYNEFAQAIKADYEPPSQSFFIMHPKYGKTAEFPIVL